MMVIVTKHTSESPETARVHQCGHKTVVRFSHHTGVAATQSLHILQAQTLYTTNVTTTATVNAKFLIFINNQNYTCVQTAGVHEQNNTTEPNWGITFCIDEFHCKLTFISRWKASFRSPLFHRKMTDEKWYISCTLHLKPWLHVK